MTMPHQNGTCQHVAYRLTCAEYEELWSRAEGRCEICRRTADEVPGGKLGIDHSHRIGYVDSARGILCPKCNALVGAVERGAKTDPRVDVYLANAWHLRQTGGAIGTLEESS